MVESLAEYVTNLSELMTQCEVTDGQGQVIPLDEAGKKAGDLIVHARSLGRKAMLCGNGGSAAVVSHVHNDLSKAANARAMVFNETPLLSALAYDVSYDTVFKQPVEMWAEEGDILIAVSSSGRSQSILLPSHSALERNCKLITFSGFADDNPLRGLGDVNFYIASDAYGLVETAHAALLHFITDYASVNS